MSHRAPSESSEKTQAVLRAATAVFLTHGFSAATTDMIQREARISKATLYACFPNKEALFVAVIEQECARMAATIQSIEAAPGNIAKTLADIGASYLGLILSSTGMALYRVVAAEAPRFPDLGRRFYLAGPKVVVSMVAARLADAADRGEVNVQAIGAEVAATLFISLVRGEAQLEFLTHPEARPSAAQLDHWVGLAVTAFLGAYGVGGTYSAEGRAGRPVR